MLFVWITVISPPGRVISPPNEFDINYLLTESEFITWKSRTDALMYWPSDSEVNTFKGEVWDFLVMTERTRLFIGYLLHGIFSTGKRKKGRAFQYPLARARGHVHWTETNLTVRSKEVTLKTVSLKMRQLLRWPIRTKHKHNSHNTNTKLETKTQFPQHKHKTRNTNTKATT